MSEKAQTVTRHSGMGAIPDAKGVTFRVWAPHAEKVYVTGTFNDWSKTSTPLAREESGYWSTDVSGAKTGDEYRYLIHGPKGPLSRIDPYARKVTGSIGNGVIYDPQAFDWDDDTRYSRDVSRSDLPTAQSGWCDAGVVRSRAGLWKTRFNSDSYNYGPNFYNHPTPDVETHEEGADGLPCSGEISIGPYTVVIFSQDG